MLFTPSFFWTVGSVSGAASVAFGAFGAHGLRGRITDPQRIASWGTAAQYQVRFFDSVRSSLLGEKNIHKSKMFCAERLQCEVVLFYMVIATTIFFLFLWEGRERRKQKWGIKSTLHTIVPFCPQKINNRQWKKNATHSFSVVLD